MDARPSDLLTPSAFDLRRKCLTASNPLVPITSNPREMAHRIVTQVFVTGARVFGRAFAEAYRHAAQTQKYQAATGSGATGANTAASSGLTLDEACKILNVSPPKGGKANLPQVAERFKRMYDLNDPKKGGSFYLQSKVLRARERIELEVREAEAAAAREEELREGWKPKLYKDR